MRRPEPDFWDYCPPWALALAATPALMLIGAAVLFYFVFADR